MSRAILAVQLASLVVAGNTVLAADLASEIETETRNGERWAETLQDVTRKKTVPIYAGDLLREYSQNEVAADKNFKGNLLVVTGQMNRVVKDDTGDAKMIVTAPEIEERHLFRNYLVICHFKKSDERLLVNRKQGEFVHCAGKCLGLKEILGDMYIYLDDCGAIERDYESKYPQYKIEHEKKEREAAEKYKAFVKSVQHERAAEKKERASQGTLRFAKKYLAEGDKKRAREWLAKVIKRHPGTPAAKEAQELLDGLENGK